jgi:hypothetical protein
VKYLLDKSYFNWKKTKLYKAKIKLKKISISEISDNITRNCWKYNIQYQIILKSSDTLLIKLIGKEKKLLLKYHKKDVVMFTDYERFLNCLENYELERGIYITTGFFKKQTYNNINNIFHKRVKKIDADKFIRKQINISKLSFLEYLP